MRHWNTEVKRGIKSFIEWNSLFLLLMIHALFLMKFVKHEAGNLGLVCSIYIFDFCMDAFSFLICFLPKNVIFFSLFLKRIHCMVFL